MPKKEHHKTPRLPQFLILGGIILLVLFILALKDASQPEAPANSGELPQGQLEAALSKGKPALAFFHSNNCQQCIIMIDTVEQVFPEFARKVVLVDVNVYDTDNAPLLESVRLQYIPTLIFYDPQGQGETYVGVMEAELLRQRLSSLVGE